MKNLTLVTLTSLFILTALLAPGTFSAQLTPAPAVAPGADTVTIVAGTALRAQLATILSTRTSKSGDPFMARVVEPIIVKGEEIVPVGSSIDGHVSMIKQPGRVTGTAEMRLIVDTITTPNDIKFSVSAGLQSAHGADGAKVKDDEGTIQGSGKSRKDEVVETGIGAGVGAGVGGIADGGTGSLYGMGIGAAAGIIHSLTKRHKDLILPQGTELTFVISRSTTAKKPAAKPVDASSQ